MQQTTHASSGTMRAHIVQIKNQYYIFYFNKIVCIRKMRPRCRVEKANKPLCALIGVPDSVAPHPCPLCGEKNPRIGFSLRAKACRFLPPVAGSNEPLFAFTFCYINVSTNSFRMLMRIYVGSHLAGISFSFCSILLHG